MWRIRISIAGMTVREAIPVPGEGGEGGPLEDAVHRHGEPVHVEHWQQAQHVLNQTHL